MQKLSFSASLLARRALKLPCNVSMDDRAAVDQAHYFQQFMKAGQCAQQLPLRRSPRCNITSSRCSLCKAH